jgi:hypothetical protein
MHDKPSIVRSEHTGRPWSKKGCAQHILGSDPFHHARTARFSGELRTEPGRSHAAVTELDRTDEPFCVRASAACMERI